MIRRREPPLQTAPAEVISAGVVPRGKNDSSSETSAVPQEPPGVNEGRINILLVDDTPDKLIALEAALSDLGQNVVKAESGPQALRHLLRTEFAVIILDVNMPGMDGFETAQMIRNRRSTSHVPIIFVTSFSTADMQVFQGYALGAVDYMFTPVMPEVLRSKVSVFIDLAKKSRQLQAQAELIRRAQEERLQRQLTDATNRLEWETRRNRFFNLSIELLAIANYDWVFTQLNPTWEKVLGFGDAELKERPFIEFVHPEDRASTSETVERIMHGDSPLYFENRFRTKEGSYRWLGWTIAPFAAEGLLYLFARDITERRQREEEVHALNENLKRHAAELQSANQELETFSYSISHDLRTPLRAINGFSEILMSEFADRFDKEGRQMLEALHRNSMNMSDLIDDFLDFFRIGRQHVSATYIDMQTLIRGVVDTLTPINPRRPVEFKIGELPPASGDPPMIRQLWLNLVSNALKFSSQSDSPIIEVGAIRQGRRYTYFVRDNGVGFDMKYYSKLFGVFQRLHDRERFEGTGIGLALVQKIVQRHGGCIWADAVVNGGATFYFTLGS